jgi:eukaryotic-like serine/threonine-protein kinase
MSRAPNTSGSASAANLSSATSWDTEVGKAVLDMGLVTQTELGKCRELQKQASDPSARSLSDLLVENEFITANQAKRLRQIVNASRSGGSIPGYQILGELGKGAMAKVFKARQLSLDRIVAVKVLPKKMSESVDFVERFHKEGQAAAKLSHNNIVQAIDVGETPDGYHYFVMEYVEGKTLYDFMAAPPNGEGKSFSEAEALDMCIQIADALAHAHERGLVHRDVKPKNILLTPQGVAKLTDLGLARSIDDAEAADKEKGKAYGTPYYISPEQIRGDVDIDARADIYSLGATMYHLVTGRPPFEGDTPSAVMHQHLRTPLTPADHVNTALSAGVGEIIDVAMAKRREDRYPSTRDMLEDLRAVRNNQPPQHARRAVDLDSLAKIEETGKTIDIPPSPSMGGSVWATTPMIVMMTAAGISLLLNIVLLLMILTKG